MIQLEVGIDAPGYEDLEGYIEVSLNEFLEAMANPDLMETYSDEDISEALALFNTTASKLLIECQRRGILENVMKRAMELQGAPKEG
jgi:hypothetical protein